MPEDVIRNAVMRHDDRTDAKVQRLLRHLRSAKSYVEVVAIVGRYLQDQEYNAVDYLHDHARAKRIRLGCVNRIDPYR